MGRKPVKINPKKGERVKQLLNEYNVTQKEIAAVLHYSPEQISYIVNGKRDLTEPAAQELVDYFNSLSGEDADKPRQLRQSSKLIRLSRLMGYDDYKTETQAFLLTNCDRLNKRETEWRKMLHDFNYADRQIKALELILYNQGFSLELSEKNEYIIFETDNRDSVLAAFTHSEIDQLLKRMARQTTSEITWLNEDKRKERKAHENMKYFFNQEEHNG